VGIHRPTDANELEIAAIPSFEINYRFLQLSGDLRILLVMQLGKKYINPEPISNWRWKRPPYTARPLSNAGRRRSR